MVDNIVIGPKNMEYWNHKYLHSSSRKPLPHMFTTNQVTIINPTINTGTVIKYLTGFKDNYACTILKVKNNKGFYSCLVN